jgi:hypothetical protein
MKLPSSRLLLTAVATLAAFESFSRAQTTPPVTTLAPYVVTGVPVDASINPLTRETDGVLGDARNPLATPRAFSTISAALVNERAIDGLREILQFTPGAYAPSSYGELTVAYIRGDVAEAYTNGQRRSNNLYGYLPSFNGVEAVDVVRGPGSVVFGAGYLTGGYVNYVTKQPLFSGPATTVTTRIGTWTPGSRYSYGNGSVQIDTTAPVSDKFAWRLSYEAKGGDTFFKNAGVKDDRSDLFGAFTWKPTPTTTLAFNAQWLYQNAPESLGVNRVTQDLIWHSLYYTGTSSDAPGSYNPGPIPATGEVKLRRDATLYSRGDYAEAHAGSAQLIATFVLSPTLTVVNRSLYDHVNRERYLQVEYAEFVRQDTFENRTEFHVDVPSAAEFPQSLVAGATVRYSKVRAFENYANEYLYNFDLTNPAQVFNEAKAFPNSYLPGARGPGGVLFFSPVDPDYPHPETDDSRVWNPAVFVHDEIKFYHNLSLLAGARYDDFSARATDPLPPAGTQPVSASASKSAASGDVSLLFRPSRTASYYVTWQSVAAQHGNLGGGGISLRDNGTIDANDLRDRSTLLETGAKFSFLDNKFYTGAALFTQKRAHTALGDKHSDIRVSGLELDAVYQPDTRFSATLNATVQQGKYLNTSPFQLGGRSILDTFAVGRGPGNAGRGTASFSPFDDQVPVGDWDLVGFSRVLVNGSVRYRFGNGFGAGLDGQWQSPQRGNLDNEWHIPSQYTLNASFFYEAKKWSANVDVLNLTDQHNWIHNGDAYTASALVMQDLPLRVQGYVKVKF